MAWILPLVRRNRSGLRDQVQLRSVFQKELWLLEQSFNTMTYLGYYFSDLLSVLTDEELIRLMVRLNHDPDTEYLGEVLLDEIEDRKLHPQKIYP